MLPGIWIPALFLRQYAGDAEAAGGEARRDLRTGYRWPGIAALSGTDAGGR